MGKVRFEVRLSAAEADRVFADMRERGAVSRADHVRDCLLAGRAAHVERLSEQLGLLGLALNEVATTRMHIDEMGSEDLVRLVEDSSAQLGRIFRDLNRGEHW